MKIVIESKNVTEFVGEILDIVEDDMAYYAGHDRKMLEETLRIELIENDEDSTETLECRIGSVKRICKHAFCDDSKICTKCHSKID